MLAQIDGAKAAGAVFSGTVPADTSHPLARKLARRVGQGVRAARKRRKLTQSQLAELAGLSIQSVSNIERGEGVSLAVLAVLGDVLGVDPADLLRAAPEPSGGARQDDVSPVILALGAEDRALVLAVARAVLDQRRSKRRRRQAGAGGTASRRRTRRRTR